MWVITNRALRRYYGYRAGKILPSREILFFSNYCVIKYNLYNHINPSIDTLIENFIQSKQRAINSSVLTLSRKKSSTNMNPSDIQLSIKEKNRLRHKW